MTCEFVASRKKAARKAAKEALRRLSAEEMAEESLAIANHLRTTDVIAAARRMAIYIHCPQLREVDTTAPLHDALASGGRVYAPRVLDRDANMHFLHITSLNELESVPPFGIREPRETYENGSLREDACEMDYPVELVIMPGLAFDSSGRRLGRGGGYYDKFVAVCRQRAKQRGWEPPLLVALSFRVQLVADVPTDDLDQPIDILVSADGVTGCSHRGCLHLQKQTA